MVPGRARADRSRRTRAHRRAVVCAAVLVFGATLLVAATAPAAPLPLADARPSLSPAPPGTQHAPARQALRGQVPEIDHDHVFVRLRSRPSDLTSRLARAGARVEGAVGRTSWTSLSTDGDAVAVKERLEHEPTVAQVKFSYVRRALTVPNDPRYSSAQRDYLSPLRMDRAWDVSKGANVKVAVVDTGVDAQHPDLSGRVLAGRSIVPTTNSVQDDNGHGTMVAGVIAANLNNGRGVVGIAPQAQILPVKVLDGNGGGTDDDIAAGITWAVDHGAQVINLSLGGPGEADVLCAAVSTALAADVVVVAAAGNDGFETVGYPAACPGVIAVAATNHSGALDRVLQLRMAGRRRRARSRHHVDRAVTEPVSGQLRDRIGDLVLYADRRGRRGTCAIS